MAERIKELSSAVINQHTVCNLCGANRLVELELSILLQSQSTVSTWNWWCMYQQQGGIYMMMAIAIMGDSNATRVIEQSSTWAFRQINLVPLTAEYTGIVTPTVTIDSE